MAREAAIMLLFKIFMEHWTWPYSRPWGQSNEQSRIDFDPHGESHAVGQSDLWICLARPGEAYEGLLRK